MATREKRARRKRIFFFMNRSLCLTSSLLQERHCGSGRRMPRRRSAGIGLRRPALFTTARKYRKSDRAKSQSNPGWIDGPKAEHHVASPKKSLILESILPETSFFLRSRDAASSRSRPASRPAWRWDRIWLRDSAMEGLLARVDRKFSLSITMNSASSLTWMLAVRTAPVRRLISPKKLPGPERGHDRRFACRFFHDHVHPAALDDIEGIARFSLLDGHFARRIAARRSPGPRACSARPRESGDRISTCSISAMIFLRFALLLGLQCFPA